MQNKIKKIQIFRRITQLIFFILLPGLFTLTFSELKSIYFMLMKGNFNFAQAFPGLIEFTTTILLTIFLGRFFCGWFCAFGTFNDFLYMISKKVFKINFKVDSKLDGILKYLKYLILLMLIVFVWTMGSQIFSTSSPWDAFAQITNFPQVLYDYAFGFIILIFISIGAMFIERFFCRYLCPLGAVFAIISKISVFKINKPNAKCGKCRLCTNNCSMGLPLYKVNNVRGGECINCLKCVETCPRRNTNANICNENINPALASSIAIAAFAGVYSMNNVAGAVINKSNLAARDTISISKSSLNNDSNSGSNNGSNNVSSTVPSTASSSSNSVKQSQYKDGTYTGTGTGFRGGTTKIEVTIANGKITNVQTISTDDTPRFYQDAESVITEEVLQAQSSRVDTVSGATFSSRGIISAVQNALSKAK